MKKPAKLLNMKSISSHNSPPPMPFHLKKSRSKMNNRYDNDDSSFSCLRSSKSPSMRMPSSNMNVTLPEHFRSVRNTMGSTKTTKLRRKKKIPNKAIYHGCITPNSGYFHTFLMTKNTNENQLQKKKKRNSGIRRSKSVLDVKGLTADITRP